MSTTATPTPSCASGGAALAAQLAGKFMTFQLGDGVRALEIPKVREIVGLLDVTPVPRAAPAVREVINLRGKVIPVVDLRLAFGMEACQTTEQAVIIVVQCAIAARTVTMGVLADRVLEVLSIDAARNRHAASA